MFKYIGMSVLHKVKKRCRPNFSRPCSFYIASCICSKMCSYLVEEIPNLYKLGRGMMRPHTRVRRLAWWYSDHWHYNLMEISFYKQHAAGCIYLLGGVNHAQVTIKVPQCRTNKPLSHWRWIVAKEMWHQLWARAWCASMLAWHTSHLNYALFVEGSFYSALSPVFSTNVVCVKTQQKHASIKHHDKTKQKYNQLKNMIQWHVFLSVPKHYN